jgi:homoserine O-acetyltransferase
MHVLEWAFETTDDGAPFVQALVPIAVGGRHTAWQIGWSEAQRQAITTDPKWRGGEYPLDDPPTDGLASARMMAMVSYRSQPSFDGRFGRDVMADQDGAPYAVESYLRYQGEKLVDRFDPGCYVALTQQMDTHDVARGRGAYEAVLESIEQPALVVGIDSDVLYPLSEQRELAAHLPRATLEVLSAPHGHDAFLIELDALNETIAAWRRDERRPVTAKSVEP